MTEIIFERKVPENEIVEKASRILLDGGIIVIPTDTIPGIGCRADDHAAVLELFRLKERPANLPIPVILADTEDVSKYTTKRPPVFKQLAEKYWPGQLTIVLESNGRIDKLVGGGLNTIGFRVPDYNLVREIVRAINCPLALTSANPHSLTPSSMHEKLLLWWKNKVHLIVLGRSTGPRPASTVVDLTAAPPGILREGFIDSDELCKMLECHNKP